MKKLSLALALVMVFAIAAPAFAITGTDVSTTTTDPLSIDLVIVNSAAYALAPSSLSSIVAAPSSYAEGSIITIAAYVFAKNKDAIADGYDNAHYYVELSGVGAAPIADANGIVLLSGGGFDPTDGLLKELFNFKTAVKPFPFPVHVQLNKSTTLSLLATTSTYKTPASAELNPVDNYVGTGSSPADLAYLYYSQYVVGTVPAEGGSITFKVTEDVPTSLTDNVMKSFWNKTTRAKNLGVTAEKDKVINLVSATGTQYKGYFITNTDGDVLTLALDGDGKVVTAGLIFTDRTGVDYTIVNTHAATFAIINELGGSVTGDPLTHAKALWIKAADYFGFDYALNGVVNDSTFLSKYPTFSLSKTVTFSSGVITITTPDSVIPPKTGDAASTFGFVMIAAAIIAAGALLVRKVRV